VIPKVIHRYWEGRVMPGQYERFGAEFLDANPGWTLCDWKVHPVAGEDGPHSRSDLFRYDVLDRLGGVCVDCDVEPLRPLDPLLEGVKCFAGWQSYDHLGSAVIGSTPGHPAIRDVLDHVGASVEKYKGRGPQFATGPYFLTERWADRPDVTRFQCEVFYPYRYDPLHLPGGTYPGSTCVHHWHSLAAPEDRVAMLDRLPKNSSGAEVGVYEGQYSRQILERAKPAALYLIDPWASIQGYDEPMNAPDEVQEQRYRRVLAMTRAHANVTLIRDRSPGCAGRFPKESLDWVYVDADHAYAAASADLAAWSTVVKVGGLLCGHDYLAPASYTQHLDLGVKQAVDEFEALHRRRFAWWALTQDGWPTFALKKP
jgi:hypothetical protein